MGAKMKQLRIDFPDYPAEQQEADVKKTRFRQVYLMKVDGDWGHLTIIDGEIKADFHPDKDLIQAYLEIKAEFPTHHVRVIRNQGLENYLRDRKQLLIRKKQNKLDARQLSIDFSKER